ncbi:nicotinate-nucleotide diphosphorylase [Parabacteroides distasonis]|nr:nicotinate-nucleotide diphosphorylase [Parabacteroides distasonis]
MDKLIDDLIKLAFAEDIGDGDHTTLCCIPETAMGKSQLIIKEDGVLAGVEMAKRIFHDFDPELKMTVFIQDGAEVKKGDIAFVVEGKIQSLLQTERLMLNVMQRMSGIATTTRKYAKALEGTKTHVLDTRKTSLKIEIEVRNFDELEQAMKVGGIDRIMLDNFNIENTKEAVRRINGRFEVESSGGITFDTLRDYAECGVDFISVGALTHSREELGHELQSLLKRKNDHSIKKQP